MKCPTCWHVVPSASDTVIVSRAALTAIAAALHCENPSGATLGAMLSRAVALCARAPVSPFAPLVARRCQHVECDPQAPLEQCNEVATLCEKHAQERYATALRLRDRARAERDSARTDRAAIATERNSARTDHVVACELRDRAIAERDSARAYASGLLQSLDAIERIIKGAI